MRVPRALSGLLLVVASVCVAQESPSFKLVESAFNAGGDPANGSWPSSASFRMNLDAIGDAALGTGPASASFRLDGGFVSGYRPPREVTGLRLADALTLVWEAEPSTGDYNLYRGNLGSFTAYGNCLQSRLVTTTTTDAGSPASRAGYYYLVTAENRLDEEGTKGTNSAGAPRVNAAPCP